MISMDKKNIRLALLFPLSTICNTLFLITTVLEIQRYVVDRDSSSTTTTVLQFTEIHPSRTPLLFASLLLFGLVLIIDTIFCIIALYEEGKKKLPVVGGSLIHHLGAFVWVLRLVTGRLPYTTWASLALLCLEFCFPLRILVNILYPKPSPRKVSRLLQVFMVYMFMQGGGAFVVVMLILVYSTEKDKHSLELKQHREAIITYVCCILYWFVQLVTCHRIGQDRLVQKAIRESVSSMGDEDDVVDSMEEEDDVVKANMDKNSEETVSSSIFNDV